MNGAGCYLFAHQPVVLPRRLHFLAMHERTSIRAKARTRQEPDEEANDKQEQPQSDEEAANNDDKE